MQRPKLCFYHMKQEKDCPCGKQKPRRNAPRLEKVDCVAHLCNMGHREECFQCNGHGVLFRYRRKRKEKA